MSPRSKKEYIETIFLRYKKASHKEKTVILNEFHKWGKIFTGCCPKVEMTILDAKVVWDKMG
jgi:hypothetical protein